MKTIAIISQKGGAGKTTLAVHLASAAAAKFVTLIVDTDPQATASRWGEWRDGADPEIIDCGAPTLLVGKLAKAAELGAELAVIDTPPHADAMARQAARLTDLILVPCRPKAFDLAAIEATAELVKASQKPAFVVLMAGPPRAPLIYREAAEVIEAPSACNSPPSCCRNGPPSITALRKVVPLGEFDHDGKAAAEIAALWRWTRGQLNMSTREPVHTGGRRMSRFAAIKSEKTKLAPASASAAADLEPTLAAAKTPARIGKKAVSGYFSPDVSRGLHLLALEQGASLQALMGEAFDDLMRKYGKHPFGER